MSVVWWEYHAAVRVQFTQTGNRNHYGGTWSDLEAYEVSSEQGQIDRETTSCQLSPTRPGCVGCKPLPFWVPDAQST